jgi:glucose/arabinose dehydrogenase
MKLPIIACARLSSAAFLLVLAFAHPASAQNGTQTTPPATTPATPPAAAAPDTQATPAPSADDDNAPPSAPVNRSQRTVAQNSDEAWSILKLAAADPKKPDNRSLAVTAIGTIQNSRIAHKLISDALVDSSIDVRIAGILAVGTSKDKGLYGNLRQMLDDKEPAIAFTAALTLWKAGDRSGEVRRC